MSGLEILGILAIVFMIMNRGILLILYRTSSDFKFASRNERFGTQLLLLIFGTWCSMLELSEKPKPLANTTEILFSIENHVKQNPEEIAFGKKKYKIDKALQRDLGLLLNKYIKNVLTNY